MPLLMTTLPWKGAPVAMIVMALTLMSFTRGS